MGSHVITLDPCKGHFYPQNYGFGGWNTYVVHTGREQTGAPGSCDTAKLTRYQSASGESGNLHRCFR